MDWLRLQRFVTLCSAVLICAGCNQSSSSYKDPDDHWVYLRSLPSDATGAVFSYDGHVLATLGQQPTLWDTSSWREIGRLDPNGLPIRFAVFSPDARRIVMVSEVWSTEAYVCDVASGRELFRILAKPGQRFCVPAFSADSQSIATSDRNNGSIDVWDATDGHLISTFSIISKSTVDQVDDSLWVNQVLFSYDGNFIASAWFEQRLVVWNRITGDPLIAVPADLKAGVKACGHPTNPWVKRPCQGRRIGIGSDVGPTFKGSGCTSAIASPDGSIGVVTQWRGEPVTVWRYSDNSP